MCFNICYMFYRNRAILRFTGITQLLIVIKSQFSTLRFTSYQGETGHCVKPIKQPTTLSAVTKESADVWSKVCSFPEKQN